jgi:hypothetical protein
MERLTDSYYLPVLSSVNIQGSMSPEREELPEGGRDAMAILGGFTRFFNLGGRKQR